MNLKHTKASKGEMHSLMFKCQVALFREVIAGLGRVAKCILINHHQSLP